MGSRVSLVIISVSDVGLGRCLGDCGVSIFRKIWDVLFGLLLFRFRLEI